MQILPLQLTSEILYLTTAQQKAVYFVALVDNKLQLFLLPFCINLALGVPDDPYLTGKLFAFQGNVVKGVGSLVHIPDNWFSLTTRIVVPTVASARELMAADTNPAITFRPYASGTADTNKVRS